MELRRPISLVIAALNKDKSVFLLLFYSLFEAFYVNVPDEFSKGETYPIVFPKFI